jgi:signal transduction histidine kinase
MALADGTVSDLQRAARLAIWPLGLALALLSILIATSDPAHSFGGGSLLASAAELAAGLSMIVCGLIVRSRPGGSRLGGLMVLAGCAWFLVEWSNPGSGVSPAFTLGLAAYAICPVLVAHVALGYPTGRLSSNIERACLTLAYLGSGLLLGVGPALFFDPSGEGCSDCPANLILLHGDSSTFDLLNRWGVRAGLAWSLLLVVLLAWRFVRASPPVRRMTAPISLAAAAFLLLAARDFAHSLARGFLSNDHVDYDLWLAQSATLCALALAVAWGIWESRRMRSSVAQLAVELGESPSPGGLRDLLADALGDPTLEVVYPLAGPDRYVDAAGHEVHPATGDGRSTTPLVRDGRAVAELIHDSGLADNPTLLEEVVAASRLTIENERLHAEVSAQLQDLRASRARIVATGDAERRRLERDLHDGAQQRLVSLSLALRMARGQLDNGEDPALAGRLDEADGKLRLALAELRELAHGIFPAVLTDEGLAAAIETFVEGAPVPVEIPELPEERFEEAVETAAYLTVVETAVRAARAGATVVTAEIRHLEGKLTIEVTSDEARADDRESDPFGDLADRLGALDGRLELDGSSSGGIHLYAEIPCG